MCIFKSSFKIFVIIAVPSAPRQVDNCSDEVTTNQTCVSWLRPSGGNAIDVYLVQWFSNATGLPISNTTVPHYPSKSFYDFTIINLQPGETINIIINVKNSAGYGQNASTSLTTSERNNCNQMLFVLINYVFHRFA